MGKNKQLRINAGIIQQYKDYFKTSQTFNFRIIIDALQRQGALKRQAWTKENFIDNYWIPKLKDSLETKFNTKIKKVWKKDKEITQEIKESLENQNCNIKNLKDYFLNWYFEKMKKGCYYCEQDNLLYVLRKRIFPEKAENKPRKFLELDRKYNTNPNNYDEENCVLACYPCNNAKSNVFNEKEFLVIGKLVGLIINNPNILSKSAKEIKKLNLSEIVQNLG